MTQLDIVKSIIKRIIFPSFSKENLIFLGAIFSLLFFAYSPLIHFDYIFHDDFYFFSNWTKESCDGYGQFWAYKTLYGRPIGGMIKCFYGMSFDSMSGAKYVRVFNIALLSIYIFLIFNYIVRFSNSKWLSILLSISIAFLTSYQTPIAQISNAHHIFAAIFALLGLLVSIKYNQNLKYLNSYNLTTQLISYILLTTSILIYQPSAMLFWSFLSIYVIFSIKNISLVKIKNVFYISIPCFLSMLTSFLYLQKHSSSRGALVADLSEKITWIQNVFPILFSYFDVLPNNFLLYTTLLIFISAILICLAQIIIQRNHKEFALVLTKLISYLGLFILSIFPLLAAKESPINHRTLMAPKTLIVILALCALYYIIIISLRKDFKKIIFRIVAVIFIAFGAVKTQSNMIHYYAVPSSLEYSFLSRKINSIDFTQGKHYHIIRPKLPYLSKIQFADEMGIPSSYFLDDSFHMIVAIVRENNINLNPKDIFSGRYFSLGDGNKILRPIDMEGKDIPQNTIFIDMNDIRGVTLKKELQ